VKIEDGIIIVTGAAGFIGSATVSHLNSLGLDRLLLVDDLESSEKWRNLVGKNFDELIRIHELFPWLEEKGDQVAAIIHLGACSDTTERNGDYLLENNTRYTQRLATFAVSQGVRFIYASSAATYGDGSAGFSDDIAHLEKLEPLNLYGFSKHLFDLWAKRQGILDKIVGLKYFNVFGPNENHKDHMASMVYKMLPNVRNEGLVRLFKSNSQSFGHGEQCRDFIYVKDAVRMTCNFLFNNIGGIFNIGRGEPTTWNQLAAALFSAVGGPTNIEYIEMPEKLMGQYQNYTCADMSKYVAAHGLQKVAATPIEEAVSDYVNGHLLKDRRW